MSGFTWFLNARGRIAALHCAPLRSTRNDTSLTHHLITKISTSAHHFIASFTASYRLAMPPLLDNSATSTTCLVPGRSTGVWEGTADCMMSCLICAAVSWGKYDLSTAAMPTTTGVAMLVPLFLA